MPNKRVYKPNFKKIADILRHPQIYTAFNGRDLSILKEAVIEMKKRQTGGKTEKALNLILETALNKPVTPILKDLADEFIVAAAHWNENVRQELGVREKIQALRNFIDYHLSVMDTIKAMKNLMERAEKIQKFSPPAFELSAHYLKSLQDLQKKKKK